MEAQLAGAFSSAAIGVAVSIWSDWYYTAADFIVCSPRVVSGARKKHADTVFAFAVPVGRLKLIVGIEPQQID